MMAEEPFWSTWQGYQKLLLKGEWRRNLLLGEISAAAQAATHHSSISPTSEIQAGAAQPLCQIGWGQQCSCSSHHPRALPTPDSARSPAQALAPVGLSAGSFPANPAHVCPPAQLPAAAGCFRNLHPRAGTQRQCHSTSTEGQG